MEVVVTRNQIIVKLKDKVKVFNIKDVDETTLMLIGLKKEIIEKIKKIKGGTE